MPSLLFKPPIDDPSGSLPEGNTESTASLIGIVVAISGNVLISLALNCQKLAHQRLEKERLARLRSLRCKPTGNNHSPEIRTATSNPRRSNGVDDSGAADGTREDTNRGTLTAEDVVPHVERHSSRSSRVRDLPARRKSHPRDRTQVLLLETTPLLRLGGDDSPIFDGSLPKRDEARVEAKRQNWSSRIFGVKRQRDLRHHDERSEAPGSEDPVIEAAVIPVDLRQARSAEQHLGNNHHEDDQRSDLGNNYLRSKLWWLGFLLMNVGEIGNFISYAFAPASVVAPLGTFALIANCFFAPLMLRERFRKRDLFGIFLAVVGAVTVVLSSNQTDTRLDPEGLIRAITQKPFIALAVIYAVGAVTFVVLSPSRIGRDWVFVDVGACALFGGFTVLSTKAFSTLLTMEAWAVFKEWITYPILAILASTGIGQIMYLNRALMKFSSKVVIPTQFVLFNLSAIVGSAVLYGDFRTATFHQVVTFLYGCGATFAGVYMITWTPSTAESPSNTSRLDDDATPTAINAEGRAQLVLPSDEPLPVAILRTKASKLNLVGLSPAQRVLLVRTPPED